MSFMNNEIPRICRQPISPTHQSASRLGPDKLAENSGYVSNWLLMNSAEMQG
jgi:hypothetical protein